MPKTKNDFVMVFMETENFCDVFIVDFFLAG